VGLRGIETEGENTDVRQGRKGGYPEERRHYPRELIRQGEPLWFGKRESIGGKRGLGSLRPSHKTNKWGKIKTRDNGEGGRLISALSERKEKEKGV